MAKPTNTIDLSSTIGTHPIYVPCLKFACIMGEASNLKLHNRLPIDGCYEITGADQDIQVILTDPLAIQMIAFGDRDGVSDRTRLEVLGIRFPAGMRP